MVDVSNVNRLITSISAARGSELKELSNFRVDAEPFKPTKQVRDDTTKLLIRDHSGSPIAVLLFSDESLGTLPERAASFSSKAISFLPENVSSAILSPISYGNFEGMSYAIWPYRRQMSGLPVFRNFQRYLVANKVLSWLLDLTIHSRSPVGFAAVQDKFVQPMLHLAKSSGVDFAVKNDLLRFVSRINEGDWRPQQVIEHGDLWLGNVLIDRSSSFGITMIDWAGAKMDGHAFYDLARISRSSKLSKAGYRKQVTSHCAVLDCEIDDSAGYLLSSFARLLQNLEHFPYSRFVQLLNSTYQFHLERTGH